MESSLDSVLGGQVSEETTAEVQQPETTVEQTQPTEQATGEVTGTPPETQKDDPLDRHRKGLEQAAAAERKRRQEAEQRAQALEQELKTLRQPQAFPTQTEDPKPQRTQFETEDAWLDARDEWRDRQREKQWRQQEQVRAEQTLKAKTESIFAEAMKLPGFDMQAFVRLPVPQAMADAILDSDTAPQLVHWLTANPGEAYRIAALSETRQVKELARIEDRLSATPKEEPELKEKPRLPETLTQARDVKGRFEGKTYDGPTPLSALLNSK
jgi:hypothetical protein